MQSKGETQREGNRTEGKLRGNEWKEREGNKMKGKGRER